MRTIRLVCWLVCAVLAVLASRWGLESASFWRDLDRWAIEPSARALLDPHDPAGKVEVEWDQDCAIVCKQGLYVRSRRGGQPNSLAGLSGSMSVATAESGRIEEYPWVIDPSAVPDADGFVCLSSNHPSPNGPSRLGIRLDTVPQGLVAEELEFELRPEMCGIEQIVGLAMSASSIGAGVVAGIVGVILLATRTPRGRVATPQS